MIFDHTALCARHSPHRLEHHKSALLASWLYMLRGSSHPFLMLQYDRDRQGLSCHYSREKGTTFADLPYSCFRRGKRHIQSGCFALTQRLTLHVPSLIYSHRCNRMALKSGGRGLPLSEIPSCPGRFVLRGTCGAPANSARSTHNVRTALSAFGVLGGIGGTWLRSETAILEGDNEVCPCSIMKQHHSFRGSLLGDLDSRGLSVAGNTLM